jgi:type I restriction enzyme S subunit
VALNEIESCTNQGCRALIPRAGRVSADFTYYALKASRDLLQAAGKGTTFMELSAGALGMHVVPLLGLDEQHAIADFLDRETAKIDTLVAKKRTLIERLKEKRTALISRTVTRGLPPDAARAAGLDPHPKLKPSGIDWLGDVPEHWDVGQLKWAVMFQRGHDLPADEREEGNVPLVSSSGVSARHSRAAAKGPGLVTGRYGTIGQFYLVEEDYWPLNTTLYSIDLRGNEPRFLQALLTHLAPLFLLNAVKSAVPGIDRNDIHPIAAAVPPRLEQAAIADFLDRETARIDAMVAKVETAIERLQEYRTALITAAVTGKIDVRALSGADAAGTMTA